MLNQSSQCPGFETLGSILKMTTYQMKSVLRCEHDFDDQLTKNRPQLDDRHTGSRGSEAAIITK